MRETMDALELLEKDHEKVRKLLDQIESTTQRGVKTREELFEKLRSELQIHELIEEEIFYPALRENPKAKELILEAYEEHNVVDKLLGELASTPVDDERWGAIAAVMKENLEHHIEEEEGELFQKAKQAFSEEELRELGERMATRKKEAQEAA
jgi:hemerythrin-like domain-containing protein